MANELIIKTIKAGGLVVMPTDTIYGVVAAALNPEAVKRLSILKQWGENKPFIILIGDLSDLTKLGIKITAAQEAKLAHWWPGSISVILGDVACRLPADPNLRELLRQTGPLVAPSANLADQPPATTIAEAKAYFGDQVELYVDGGRLVGEPSTLVKLTPDGEVIILRGILKGYGTNQKS